MAYTSLDRDRNVFRLLHLKPASSEDDTIRCEFSTSSLDEDVRYEALSYSWGEASEDQDVEVGEHRISINSNLLAALKNLRSPDETRILWVDALCIDQSNSGEKTHQVSRMAQIYGQAFQVVVWFGEGWDGSDMAMEFLSTLGQNDALHLDPRMEPAISVNGRKLDSLELRQSLIRLFDLRWWKRIWTVQEFVLAKQLLFQCRKSTVTQEAMYMARENFWAHKDRCCPLTELDSPPPGYSVSLGKAFEQPAKLDFVSKRRVPGVSYSLLLAMASFSVRGALEPLDRIYGMLGLGTGPYTDLVTPDYEISPEQLCEAVAIKSTEQTGTLEFLSHLFDHENTRLPSFLPNWTGKYDWNPVYEMRLDHVNNFSASQNLLAEFQLISGGILITQGIKFDTIKATSPTPLLQQLLLSDALKDLEDMAGLRNSHHGLYCHTADPLRIAFWHTLCGGMEMVLQDSNRFSRRLKGSTDISKYFRWKTICAAPHELRSELLDNEFNHILLDVETATEGRRFFVTEKGYFGLGPRRCQKGDMVAVLRGGNVAYVLRAVSPLDRFSKICKLLMRATNTVGLINTAVTLCSKGLYTILGDSYVHGIMDGEALGLHDGIKQGLDDIVLV